MSLLGFWILTPSNSCFSTVASPSTPTTVNQMSFTLIFWLSTSPNPNSFCLAAMPSTQTWALASSSAWRKKAPCSNFRFWMTG